MNRQLLEQPFPKELLKTRKGTFGKSFTYVEGAEYIRKLNEAFEGDWSFEVVEHQILDTEVIVLGKLTAEGVSKMDFGVSTITVARGTGEVVSLGQDIKSATTDCVKRCSRQFGLGLSLYSEEPTSETNRRSDGQSPPQRRGNTRPSNGGNGRSNGNGNNTNGNRLTQKQLSCIWGMARSLGRSVEELRRHTLDAYAVQPEQLSKSDASNLITELGESLAQISRGAA